MGKALRIHFWMLGQDLRFGLPAAWGYKPGEDPKVHSHGPLHLHRHYLCYHQGEDECRYCRETERFTRERKASRPVERARVSEPEASRMFGPWIRDYERFVNERMGPEYRRKLLRICPPKLRPYRRHWKALFAQDQAPAAL